MTNKADEHQRLILEQFTRQAVPFSQMQNHSPELLLAASGASPADTVLDVACGPGLMACAFAKVARRVTGVDLTPAMIEQAKVMQQADGLTNLTWHVGDVQRLPFADASFSLVFTRYSFHHLLDWVWGRTTGRAAFTKPTPSPLSSARSSRACCSERIEVRT